MNIYNDDIVTLLLFSFALGAVLGVAYDILHAFIFRANERQMENAKSIFSAIEYISLFLADLVFCLFFGASALILMYNLNKGVFRCTVYVLMGFGFMIYRVTLSKFIRRVLLSVRFALWLIGGWIYRILSIPIRLIFKIYHLTMGRIVCIIICRMKNKREKRIQKKRERTLKNLVCSGKDEYVTSSDNSKDKKKERIFIGRKDA